jgi:hypothetical protein
MGLQIEQKDLRKVEQQFGKSRFLLFNSFYDAAYSTCGSILVVLPKILLDSSGYTCLCKSIITTKSLTDFEILLNQTLISLELPRHLQLDNYILTPNTGEDFIKLNVAWIEDRSGWQKPVFEQKDLQMRNVKLDED